MNQKNTRSSKSTTDSQDTTTVSADEEILRKLTSQRVEFTQRLQAIKKDAGTGLNADSAEQVVELENADVLNELAREAEEELGKVNAAIARLKSGLYGVCVTCEEPIPKSRLSAYPAAVDCVGCADT